MVYENQIISISREEPRFFACIKKNVQQRDTRRDLARNINIYLKRWPNFDIVILSLITQISSHWADVKASDNTITAVKHLISDTVKH